MCVWERDIALPLRGECVVRKSITKQCSFHFIWKFQDASPFNKATFYIYKASLQPFLKGAREFRIDLP